MRASHCGAVMAKDEEHTELTNKRWVMGEV